MTNLLVNFAILLLKINKADLAQAVNVLSCAFRNYPLYDYLIPDEQKRADFIPLIHEFILKDSLAYGHTYALSQKFEGITHYLPPGKTHMDYLRIAQSGGLKLIFNVSKSLVKIIVF